MRHRNPAKTLFAPVLLGCSALSACGGTSPVLGGPTHDTPVPAEESRAELKLRVDLPLESACEESFDLALYKQEGVDLIQWDKGAGCSGRTLRIRYLPKRLSQNALWEIVRKNAAKAEELK